MKIVELYLKAVGSRLPWRSRKDIVDELRSLLMDQIEAACGESSDEEAAGRIIMDFGSPAEVARRYRGDRQVIAAGLSGLYFMILGILAGALAIAFTTVFLVEILPNPVYGAALARRLLQIPLQTVSAWFGAVGGVTLVFIILSRVSPDLVDDPDEKWDIRELKNVQLDNQIESRPELVISIVFLSFLIVLMNTFPGIITVLENLFMKSRIPLGHRIVTDVFRNYVYFLSAVWLGGIALSVLKLRRGENSTGFRLAEICLSTLEIFIQVLMLTDRNLFTGHTGWIGFKVIIAITLTVNCAETITGLVKLARARIAAAGSR